MAQGIDQWTAGGLALRTIARWIIDGGDSTKMREFIRWLSPTDVVQTEHLFILAALKDIDGSGGELSIHHLKEVLAPRDPAYFVAIVLDNIIANRHAGPNGGPEFDELVTILKGFRPARNREM